MLYLKFGIGNDVAYDLELALLHIQIEIPEEGPYAYSCYWYQGMRRVRKKKGNMLHLFPKHKTQVNYNPKESRQRQFVYL